MMENQPTEPVFDVTCEQVAAWASAYLDGQVPDEEKIRIVLHLAACAGCEAYVKQIATVRCVLARWPGSSDRPADLKQLRMAFAARWRNRSER